MKNILFIGQAPARPSSRHEIPGSYLHTWLYSIGFSDDMIKKHCHFYALTDIFPGSSKNGHLPPTKQQIAAHRPTLQRTIRSLQPDIIVPVGKMAISEIMQQKDIALEKVIGQNFTIDPFDSLDHVILCIPLPHPSGRSSWNHTHKQHVQSALQMLGIAFK